MAVVAGTAPFSYQWKFNNNPILGATNTSLTLTSLTTNAAGSYSVMVTNVVGATNSAAATLTVPRTQRQRHTYAGAQREGEFHGGLEHEHGAGPGDRAAVVVSQPDVITLNEIPNGFRAR